MCTVIFSHPDGTAAAPWLIGSGLREVIVARTGDEVAPALEWADVLAEQGLWSAGFVSYEAASGLDAHLAVHRPGRLPLVWLGVFEELAPLAQLPASGQVELAPWQPSQTREDYGRSIRAIREWIASGDTYQVNYTLRLAGKVRGPAIGLFERLWRAQPSGCCAFIETGQWAVCSASPELFWDLRDGELISMPMKGTARRGLWYADDLQRRSDLARSTKDRAENAMIVDMVRNDVGRIAQPDSVSVRDAFAVEKHPTVYQMTSTVACRTGAGLADIFRAMFPCASITGAPKVRTMQIIRQLEPTPRGVYCGAIGWWGPGRRGRFSVAIRTAVVDKSDGAVEYGVGGGIVWDSDPDGEWAECQAKAAVLGVLGEPFELLETLRYEPNSGYILLEEHLGRLTRSAEYFDFALDGQAVRDRLTELANGLGASARVRLRVDQRGRISVESAPAPAWNPATPSGLAPSGAPSAPRDPATPSGSACASAPPIWRVKLAKAPIRTDDVMLYHKTTRRAVYEAALQGCGDADDVLLWNARGELTETTLANIVVDVDGRRVTPPVECGLLEGVFRAHLLETGQVELGVVRVDDLPRAGAIWAVNSVRGWMRVQLER